MLIVPLELSAAEAPRVTCAVAVSEPLALCVDVTPRTTAAATVIAETLAIVPLTFCDRTTVAVRLPLAVSVAEAGRTPRAVAVMLPVASQPPLKNGVTAKLGVYCHDAGSKRKVNCANVPLGHAIAKNGVMGKTGVKPPVPSAGSPPVTLTPLRKNQLLAPL